MQDFPRQVSINFLSPALMVTEMTSTIIILLVLPLAGILANHEKTLCTRCICDDTWPYLIDCSKQSMDTMFPDDDWPDHRNITSIDVDLSYNNLKKIDMFKHLPIVSINYHGNSISQIADHAFKYLNQLAYLDLSRNQLAAAEVRTEVFRAGYDDTEIMPLQLKVLLLGHNQIHSINMDAFDYLPKLEELYLNDNPIMVIDQQTEIAITKLRNLTKLHLANTGLKMLPLGVLSALKFLRTLILSGNKFESVPEALHSTYSLQSLNLNNNPIQVLDIDSFTGLGDLRELGVSEMPKLVKIRQGAFGPLRSLRLLRCSDNFKLHTIHTLAFEGVPTPAEGWPLTEISLRNNALTYLPRPLLPWDDIQVIDIQENPWVCDCRISWIIVYLIPIIAARTPELTENLMCKSPLDMEGHSLVSLTKHSADLLCRTQKHTFSYQSHKWTRFGNTSLILLLTGLLLLIGGILGFLVLYRKRRKMRNMYQARCQIHYRHADNFDSNEDVTTIPEKEKMLETVHEEAKTTEDV